MHAPLDPTHPHRRFGWPLPPLAGGAPDEDVDGQAPPEPAAPSAEDSAKIELPFRLEEVQDESHREWLQGRQAQMQAGFDKELNRLRSEGASAKPLQELAARLDDPDTQQEALAEFLAQHGVELDYDDEPAAEPAVIPEENEALRRVEILEAQAESDNAAERERAFYAHVDAGLDAFAVQEGHKVGGELPEIARDQLLQAALALPRLENGLLDMSGAVTQYDAQRAFHAENARKGYLKSKDTPFVDLSGEAGDPQVDLTKKSDRLAAANAIAGRHL